MNHQGPIDGEPKDRTPSRCEIAGAIIAGVLGILTLAIIFTPIDGTIFIHFDMDSYPEGMIVGNRLGNDIDSDPENPAKRVLFRMVGYPTVSYIVIPEALADYVIEACVEQEYRFLPSMTRCYPMERIED